MKAFVTTLKILLIVASVAGVGYAFTVYVVPLLPVIFIFGYFFVSCLMLLTGVVALLRAQQPRSPAEIILQTANKAQSQKNIGTAISYWGDRVGALLGIISGALIWPLSVPVGAYFIVRGKADVNDPRQMLLQAAQHLVEPLQSLAVLGLITFWVFLANLGIISDAYVRLFVGTLLVSVVLRLIGMTIVAGGLPQLLRRKTRQPYSVFLVIAALDALALLEGFNYLRLSSGAVTATSSFGVLADTASLLFDPRTLMHTIQAYFGGTTLARDDIMVGVAGLINYVAIVKNLLSWGEFQRRDDDFIWLAQLEIARGHPAQALRHLNELSPNSVGGSPALSIKAAAYTGLGQFDRASAALTKMLEDSELGKPSHDALVSSMLGIGAVTPIGPEVSLRLFKWAAAGDTSDWVLFSGVSTSLQAATAETGHKKDARAILVQQLQRALAGNNRALPLANSIIRMELGEPDEARKLLTQSKMNHPIEGLHKLALLQAIETRNPETKYEEDKVSFSNWADANIASIQSMVADLELWYEKLAALVLLHAFRSQARGYQHYPEETFLFMADGLCADLKRHEVLSPFTQSIESLMAR